MAPTMRKFALVLGTVGFIVMCFGSFKFVYGHKVHNVPKVMGPLLLHAFATFLAIPYLPNGWLTYPSRGAKVSGFLIFLFRTAATVVMNLVLTSPWVVVIWKLPEAAREHLEAHSYAALDGGPSPLALARGWSAAVVGFILWSIMRNENVKVAPPPPEGAPKKRVAIVGAGLAGLVTAKECLEQGSSPTVFEAAAGPLGLWGDSKERGAWSVWEEVMSTTSSISTLFSDHPDPACYEEGSTNPVHMSKQALQRYLRSYMQRFGLGKVVQYSAKVVEVRKSAKDGGWWVTVSGPCGEEEEAQHFDMVVYATGFTGKVRQPDIEGLGAFKGEVLVAGRWETARDLAKASGKRVLVIGAGESSSDLSPMLGEVCDTITVAIRSPTIVLPRSIFNHSAPDYEENRNLFATPGWLRFWFLTIKGFMWCPMMQMYRRNTKEFPYLSRAGYFKWSRMGWMKAWSSLDFEKLLVTKSDGLMRMCDWPNTRIVYSGVRRVEGDGRTVTFSNGETGEYDVILLSTGFLISVPRTVAADGVTEDATVAKIQIPGDVISLYKYCVHPIHGTLAFVGFARPQFGALTNVAEIQARWVALLAAGRRSLPDERTMARHIAHARRFAETRRFVTRGSPIYVNYIARTEVGCEPSAVRILFEEGFRVFWLMWSASTVPAQYRFHGPGAKPAIARTIFTESDPRAMRLQELPGVNLSMLCLLLLHPVFIAYSRAARLLLWGYQPPWFEIYTPVSDNMW